MDNDIRKTLNGIISKYGNHCRGWMEKERTDLKETLDNLEALFISVQQERDEIKKRYAELGKTYGCGICPSCGVAAPSGYKCERCYEKELAKLTQERDEAREARDGALTVSLRQLRRINQLESDLTAALARAEEAEKRVSELEKMLMDGDVDKCLRAQGKKILELEQENAALREKVKELERLSPHKEELETMFYNRTMTCLMHIDIPHKTLLEIREKLAKFFPDYILACCSAKDKLLDLRLSALRQRISELEAGRVGEVNGEGK